LSVKPAKVSYMSQPKGFQDKVSLIWSVADILRGDFKPHEYGQTILPFVVLRRLECALEKTKDKVIAKSKSLEGKINDLETILNKESGHNFYNTSPLSLTKILQDPDKVASNLNSYIRAFSPSASEVLDKYGFPDKIKKLEEQGLLYQIIGKFADLDLSEETVSNEAMGYVFEELLRKFSEMSNETAGEHYTPREVIRLMVNLLFIEDAKALAGQKPIRSIYDPACGTGGMLSIAEEYLHDLNPNIKLNVFGQELNPETWAIARSDLMIKGQDPTRITLGNSLNQEDGHTGKQFDYCISNPPYGVDWKKYQEPIEKEHKTKGFGGRYGAGLPRVSDGSFLFIQHMISKMKPIADNPDTTDIIEGGTRIAIILSGSPLFSGQAGSGESEIRRWIIENDLLEGIVAMPDQMFYNTGIGTYIWIISNRKDKKSKGLVRLVDARDFGTKMRKSLGDKRKELTNEAIVEITELYSEAISNKADRRIKVMRNDEFGFARLTVERPLRPIWKVDAEILEIAPAALRDRLQKLLGSSFASHKDAEDAIKKIGFEGKEIKAALKAITSTDPAAQPIAGKKEDFEPDANLRDNESIPLPIGFIEMSEVEQCASVEKKAEQHLNQEILKYLPDAWIDHSKTKIGYEIPFTRQFYSYIPPRPVDEIKREITNLESEIQRLVKEIG
jgi:type I restriction enzyme M protein